MTEDDTFNTLRRTPFEQVKEIIIEMNRRFQSIQEKTIVLEEHGWDINEYEDLLDQRKIP
jgi:hypothetical protein